MLCNVILKRLELHPAATRAALTPLSCSSNFPRAQYEMINNQGAPSAELVMIISYPASPNRIILLLKTLRHIIENLKKKSERKERSYKEY